MRTILSLSFLLATLTARAEPAKAVYHEIFDCVTETQAKDAVLISIDLNQNGAQFLHVQTTGINLEIALDRSGQVGLLDNATFLANGIKVVEKAGIEDPPKRASVVLDGFNTIADTTFSCSPSSVSANETR